MGRRDQIKERRIRQLLGATWRADEIDAPFPQISPDAPIFLPNGLESTTTCQGNESNCLVVWLRMELA